MYFVTSEDDKSKHRVRHLVPGRFMLLNANTFLVQTFGDCRKLPRKQPLLF